MSHPHRHPSKRCWGEKAQPSGPQNETLFGNRVGAGVVSEDEVMLSSVDPTSNASRVFVKKWSCEDTEPRGKATW